MIQQHTRGSHADDPSDTEPCYCTEKKTMPTFYLTFGQKYPWRNGWVEVKAPDMETAREWCFEIFDGKFCGLYNEVDFNKTNYPAGKLGETIE